MKCATHPLSFSAENDSGWVAHFMYRLDHVYEKFGVMWDKVGLKLKPSEYVRRNVWVTFQDDMIGPMTWRYFGADNYMWASDFPHADSTWPDSLKVIAKDFEGIPDDVMQSEIVRSSYLGSASVATDRTNVAPLTGRAGRTPSSSERRS